MCPQSISDILFVLSDVSESFTYYFSINFVIVWFNLEDFQFILHYFVILLIKEIVFFEIARFLFYKYQQLELSYLLFLSNIILRQFKTYSLIVNS
jgi:hypothetical protein